MKDIIGDGEQITTPPGDHVILRRVSLNLIPEKGSRLSKWQMSCGMLLNLGVRVE